MTPEAVSLAIALIAIFVMVAVVLLFLVLWGDR